MPQNDGTLLMEDATMIFRNFAGKEGKYNAEGDRNFCVLLEPALAEVLDRDGWNVKSLRAREEGDPEQPYLQVSVSFRNRPPRIVLITGGNRTVLEEDMVEVIDWIDIRTTDMVIRPYSWAVGSKTGVKAYLKTLYVVLHEDPLDMKYQDLNELPSRSGRVMELTAEPSMEIVDGEVVE